MGCMELCRLHTRAEVERKEIWKTGKLIAASAACAGRFLATSWRLFWRLFGTTTDSIHCTSNYIPGFCYFYEYTIHYHCLPSVLNI